RVAFENLAQILDRAAHQVVESAVLVGNGRSRNRAPLRLVLAGRILDFFLDSVDKGAGVRLAGFLVDIALDGDIRAGFGNVAGEIRKVWLAARGDVILDGAGQFARQSGRHACQHAGVDDAGKLQRGDGRLDTLDLLHRHGFFLADQVDAGLLERIDRRLRFFFLRSKFVAQDRVPGDQVLKPKLGRGLDGGGVDRVRHGRSILAGEDVLFYSRV